MTDVNTLAAPPFPSAAALRDAHNKLLKRHRALLEQPADGADTTPTLAAFLTEVEEFIHKGRATGTVIDTDNDRWASQSLLDYWATILYRADYKPRDTTLAEFDYQQVPELDDSLCPYLGLDAFQEAQQQYFFGRQRMVEEVIGHLKERRLIAVVGPSGSGKSSLVLAGILPALKAGALPGSQNWRYYPPLVPGSDPLVNLARAIAPSNENAATRVRQEIVGFKQDSDHLYQLVSVPSGEPAVIIVDQFEEIFTLCNDDEQREAFIANLVSLVQAPGPKHTVILTLRIDFEPKLASLKALHPLFESGQGQRVYVTSLGARELREAIEKPAERIGLKFDAGLVDTLVKELLGEAAGLPLLQFALLELWKRRERNRITWNAYRDLTTDDQGRQVGVRKALTLSADRFYHKLIPQDQATAKRILLRLARPTEGIEVLRNRVQRTLLYKSGEARDQVDRVIEKLVAARLVRLTKGETEGDDQVEVAHEALVRNWGQLVEWLAKEHDVLRQRLRLTAAAEQWQEHEKDPGGLLRGLLLEEAARHEDLSPLEEKFVAASQHAARQAEEEKEAARQRELEQAKIAAEQAQIVAKAERQRGRFKSFVVICLSIVLVILIGLVVYARRQRNEAFRLREEATELQKKLNKEQEEKLQKVTEENARIMAAINRFGLADEILALINESVQADSARQKEGAPNNTSAADQERRSKSTLQCFLKGVDQEKVLAALRELGFGQVEVWQPRGATQTNAIWFGNQLTTEDVKLVAYTLIRAGVRITYIGQINAGRPFVIQVGGRPLSAGDPVYTVERLQRTDSFPK